MNRSSRILSGPDLEFLLFEWLDTDDLLRHPRYSAHSRETIRSLMSLAEQVATDQFMPANQVGDRDEPSIEKGSAVVNPAIAGAIKAFTDAGFLGAAMDDAVGGFQLPHVIERACFLWFQAANVSASSYAMLTMANANLISQFGSATHVNDFVSPMIEGRFFGTMCLSEPQAGSSLADIATRAVDHGDHFRIFGSKMWISAGDHNLGENIIHLVLARVDGAPSGVKGLSLFIVPKLLENVGSDIECRNDITLVGLNHKMGNRGTTNTVLNFGEGVHEVWGRPGAVGYLVGEAGRGLEYMFQMMNEARIAVGSSAAALGYTGYLHALAYAKTRVQGRVPGRRPAEGGPVPIIEHADVRRMLLASKSYVEGGVALVLYAAHLMDQSKTGNEEVADRARDLLDVLTPIVKSWPSQWCLAANDIAIQIHGGYGYTRDYPVEQFYRDNRLNSIHEGTHGIQGLDLLGRRIRMNDGKGLNALVAEIRESLESSPVELAADAATLKQLLDQLVEVTEDLWKDGDSARALANSSVYLEAAGHLIVAWIWFSQCCSALGRDGALYEGKRLAFRYFFDYELPKVPMWLDGLVARGSLLVDLDVNAL